MAQDERLRALYELPLDRFTPARNELADALKGEGDTAEAKKVRSLRKPSIAAWTVNQLARRHADELDALLALRDRLASSDADEVREASAERHRSIAELTEKARKILEDAGHSAAAQTLAKVSGTLYGGATEDERAALRTGTLARELEPGGFGDISGSIDAGGTTGSSRTTERAATARDETARRKREELEAQLAEADGAAAELDKAARRAARAADAAQSEAQAARERVERLRTRVERLQG
ncbi:MAG: hypothetical protein ACRDLB_14615 [Actinomycetota bacterium]